MRGGHQRVFLSHTSELREFPKGRSFVAAAETGAIRAQFVVTDMAYFAARDRKPAEYCRDLVGQADVFVGIVGFRYGSPVRDRPDISYVELEFETATHRGLPRLIFLLDERSEIPLPVEQLIDLEYGRRQAAFRRRLQEDAGVSVVRVASPLELEARLYQALVELEASADTPVPSGKTETVGASVAVPLGRLPMEVRGREDLLRSLPEERGLVVLAGMGGVGKSTVAAEVARLVQPDRPVWWVSATDASSLAGGLATVARRLGASQLDLEALATQAGDAPDRLWTRLDDAPEGWLLIFDNADEPGLLATAGSPVADGIGWIRPGRHGLVLVTTRQADHTTWGRLARFHRLNSLSDPDAAQVLLDLAPHAGHQIEAEALGRRLGGLPLALHLAGSYLGSGITRWSSFASYLEALEHDPAGARLLSPDPDSDRSHDPRATVMNTWELSLDDLARHGLPHARAVLRLLSCFAPAVPIPLDMLEPAALVASLAETAREGAPGDGASDIRFEQALRGLARVGLIDTVDGQRAVMVHPLISDANRAHLLAPSASNPDPTSVWQGATGIVAAAAGSLRWARPGDWPRFRHLTPHLRTLLAAACHHIDTAHLAILMEATARVVDAYQWSGEIATAADLTATALAHDSLLGIEHPAILTLRHHRAYQAGRQGRWMAAEAEFREVLAVRERVVGGDHADTLFTRHELAWTMAKQGRSAEAEIALRDVLTAKQRLFGGDHPSTSATRSELAETIARQGRWTEAEMTLREVFNVRLRVLGEEHPYTLAARHSLAWAACKQGRYDEAEATYRQLLEVQQRVLGGEHPGTLATQHGLACVVADLGRWAEAETLYRDVVNTRARVLGEDHPATLGTRHSIAWALANQNMRTEAAGMYRDVLQSRSRLLGDNHPDTVATRQALDELGQLAQPDCEA